MRHSRFFCYSLLSIRRCFDRRSCHLARGGRSSFWPPLSPFGLRRRSGPAPRATGFLPSDSHGGSNERQIVVRESPLICSAVRFSRAPARDNLTSPASATPPRSERRLAKVYGCGTASGCSLVAI